MRTHNVYISVTGTASDIAYMSTGYRAAGAITYDEGTPPVFSKVYSVDANTNYVSYLSINEYKFVVPLFDGGTGDYSVTHDSTGIVRVSYLDSGNSNAVISKDSSGMHTDIDSPST